MGDHNYNNLLKVFEPFDVRDYISDESGNGLSNPQKFIAGAVGVAVIGAAAAVAAYVCSV